MSAYREITAHLRLVPGVKAGIIPKAPGGKFDYLASQVAGLWVQGGPSLDETAQTQLQTILDFYAERFGAWESIAVPPECCPTTNQNTTDIKDKAAASTTADAT